MEAMPYNEDQPSLNVSLFLKPLSKAIGQSYRVKRLRCDRSSSLLEEKVKYMFIFPSISQMNLLEGSPSVFVFSVMHTFPLVAGSDLVYLALMHTLTILFCFPIFLGQPPLFPLNA